MKRFILTITLIAGALLNVQANSDEFRSYTYDSKGYIRSKRDEAGNVTYYERDRNGMLSRRTTVDAPAPVSIPSSTPAQVYRPSPAPSRASEMPPVMPNMPPANAPRKALPPVSEEITPSSQPMTNAEIAIWLHDEGYNGISASGIEAVKRFLSGHSLRDLKSALPTLLIAGS
jgi:YD repeat-containing protein